MTLPSTPDTNPKTRKVRTNMEYLSSNNIHSAVRTYSNVEIDTILSDKEPKGPTRDIKIISVLIILYTFLVGICIMGNFIT